MKNLGLVLFLLALASCAGAPEMAAPPTPRTSEQAALPTMPEPQPKVAEPRRIEPGAPLKIGLLLPLSGREAEIGRNLLDAAQLALFAIGDPGITLIPRDTGATPEDAANAATAVLDEGAQIILGPYFSASVAAAAPIARARGVKMLAFSNSRSVAGDGVYLLGFLPEFEVARIVAHAREIGLKRFAALIPDSVYGQLVAEAFRAGVEGSGGEIDKLELYSRDTQGLDAYVRRLGDWNVRQRWLEEERANLRGFGDDDLAREMLARLARVETLGEVEFDAVFLPEGGLVLKALAPLLPYYDIDPAHVRLLGTGLWDDPSIRSEPAMQGARFAGPDPAAAEAFAARFSAVYKVRPMRLASLAYDGVAIAAWLARAGGGFTDAALRDPQGFRGIDGVLRFHADGVAERGLAVIEVRRSGFKVISPAPTSFSLSQQAAQK